MTIDFTVIMKFVQEMLDEGYGVDLEVRSLEEPDGSFTFNARLLDSLTKNTLLDRNGNFYLTADGPSMGVAIAVLSSRVVVAQKP